MGFFTKNDSTSSSGGLLPLSKHHISQALDRTGWNFGEDDDGDLAAAWDQGTFFFLPQGNDNEILSVLGGWRVRLNGDAYDRAVQLCNEWNLQTRWPKTYAASVEGDDQTPMVHLRTEHNVDYEHGVTTDQLLLHIGSAVSSSMQFFEKLNEAFPEEWAAQKPEES